MFPHRHLIPQSLSPTWITLRVEATNMVRHLGHSRMTLFILVVAGPAPLGREEVYDAYAVVVDLVVLGFELGSGSFFFLVIVGGDCCRRL